MCFGCQCLLTEENWYPCDRKRPRFTCKKCREIPAPSRVVVVRKSYCRKCGVLLTSSNWYPSRKKYGKRICKMCFSPPAIKRCRRCKVELNATTQRLTIGHSRRMLCTLCYNSRQREVRTPSWRRTRRLRQTYGIDEAAWNEIFSRQGNKCACCGVTTPLIQKTPRKVPRQRKLGRWKNGIRWKTDHDHRTGKVRGIVCARCNLLLAGLDSELLPKLIEYLSRF